MRKSWPSIPAVLLGLAAVAVVLAAHLRKLDDHAELHCLDLRFGQASTLPPCDDILHVNIDDGSIDRMGRFPWPRQQLADVVAGIKSLRPQAVAMDIILTEPQEVRYIVPGDELGDDAAAAEPMTPLAVLDDAALADAIASPPASDVAMHVRMGPLASSPPQGADAELARLLQGNPAMSLQQCLATLGPKADGQRASLAKVYLSRQSLGGMDDRGVAVAPAGPLVPTGQLVPPLAMFAGRAGAIGFVSFRSDVDNQTRRIALLVSDGRRTFAQFALPMAVRQWQAVHGRCLVNVDHKQLRLEFADGWRREIPLDDQGNMLVNWPARRLGLSELPAAVFAELSAKRRLLSELPGRETQLRLRLLKLGSAVPPERQTDYFNLVELLGQMDQATRNRQTAARAAQSASLYGAATTAPAGGESPTLSQLVQQEADLEAQVSRQAKSLVDSLAGENALAAFLAEPASADVHPKTAAARLILDRLAALPAQATQARADIAELEARLRPMVAGKICLIGSTATAAADFVPTPLAAQTPGVQVHSSILRTLLSGAFIRQAPLWADILATVLCGLAVCLLAAWWPVVRASAALLVLAGGATAGNFFLFSHWGIWLALVAPLAAMGASFLVITAYRQLTEERSKRQIKSMFSKSLSPVLVERLIENPTLLEVRHSDVTLMFSDLAGFTALSERLGPQQTVRLLNRYFDRVTAVVQTQQGGYLNKFLGDGVFAIFGWPVSQDDHPRRAVQAAIDCQRQVRLLNEELTREGAADATLSVRFGLASGTAMAGNCGSSQRVDYTTIGDCVNLASRLEAANKFFRTRVLASGETAARCGDQLLRRPMGQVHVAGVASAVSIYEILDERDVPRSFASAPSSSTSSSAVASASSASAAASSAAANLEQFNQAMSLLAAGRFAQAADIFAHLEQAWPNDGPTKIFHELARTLLAGPIGPTWQPAGHPPGGNIQIAWPWK